MKRSAFIIYDASAGSGKTYTLTKEYLKILFLSHSNDTYKRILAITFTNKAVEEMKTRILDSLFEFSKEDISVKSLSLLKDLSQETGLSLMSIKDKSKAIIREIIHNYSAFGILTIDKFTHRVIRSFAQDLKLPPNFEVSLDTDILLQEAVDKVVSKVGEDKGLTQLLVDFTKDKADEDKNWDITKELVEVSQLLVNDESLIYIQELESKEIKDFVLAKKELKLRIADLSQQNIESAKRCFELLKENQVEFSSFSRNTFPKHLESILNDNFEFKNHNKYQTFEDIQINKSSNDKEVIEAISGKLLLLLKGIYENISKIFFYQAFLNNINPLSLLNSIHKEFKEIQKEQKLVSISDFNKIIFNELQGQPAPFIYEKLGERYRHFFIDEFQDTSVMQWNNLIPLIDNALAGEDYGQRGSLMIVGDPKQAIYRWRGGKAEQFIELTKESVNPFSNKDKNTVSLETNYRSFDEVIDFNNHFFSFISNKFYNQDYKDLYENHSFQKSNGKKGGYVKLVFINSKEEEFNQEDETGEHSLKVKLYLDKTLDIINDVLEHGFDFKDIVLLTRKKSEGVFLANYLTEKNIPILSSETLLIQNASEVKMIIDVLKYLKNKSDKEAKVRMLYFIAVNHLKIVEVHDFIFHSKDLEEKDLESFLQKYGIDISFNHCRRNTLYEMVEIVVSIFLKEKSNTSYVQYFLDLVLEKDNKQQYGVVEFLYYWEKTGYKKSIPSPEGNNAVRIMTIHKSKGLEFPVVIYPFAEENFAKGHRSRLWVGFEEENIGFEKALINNKKEVQGYSKEAKSIFEEKEEEDLLDIVNVLYVALTRAEQQLYVVSNHLVTQNGFAANLSSYFLEFLEYKKIYLKSKMEYEFGSPVFIGSKEKIELTSNKIALVKELFDVKKIKIAQKEALMWGSEQSKAIEYGNLLHEILAYVKEKSDIEKAINRGVEEGMIEEGNKKVVQSAIESIVNHDLLKEFFDQGKVYNEHSIIVKGLGNVKPDKVIIKQNKAYLLDYKTGQKKEIHRTQVNDYAEAVKEMGFEIVKKVLVYIGESIEIVHL